MKLELGKSYRNKRGQKVTLREMHGVHYRGQTTSLGDFPQTIDFRPDGRHWFDDISHHELVGEWIEPAPSLAAVPAAAAAPTLKDLIYAVLDGKKVQQWITHINGDKPSHYADLGSDKPATIRFLVTYPDRNYRLKPESVVRWVPLTSGDNFGSFYNSEAIAKNVCKSLPDAKLIRIELDPDTLAVISATTEAP